MNVHIKIWTTPIDNGRCADNITPVIACDVDRLPGRLAGRDDVLNDQNSFARRELKPSPKRQTTIATLGKHGTHAERARHFVSDDQASECGRQHHLWCPDSSVGGHCRPELRRMIGMLKNQCTLEISRAVKT